MKLLMLVTAIVLCVCSCTDEPNSSIQDFAITKSNITDVIPGVVSTSNPNLIDDWENQNYIYLSSTGFGIKTPWATGSNHSMPLEFSSDIKKEDGWIMLMHTFKAIGNSPKCNYLFFYNRLRGVIKVFYYLENLYTLNNGFLWILGADKETQLFNMNKGGYISPTKNENATIKSLCFSNASMFNPSNGFREGWNGFHFEVPYCTDYKDINFSIIGYNNLISKVSFVGETSSTIAGTSTSTTKQESGTIQGNVNLNTATSQSMIDEAKKKVNNPRDTTFNATLGESLKNNLNQNSNTNAVNGGLNLTYSSTTTTSTGNIALSTIGKITIAGENSTVANNNIQEYTNFNFYDIMNANINSLQKNPLFNSIVLPEKAITNSNREEFLGVWNVNDTPTISISRYSFVMHDNQGGTSLQIGRLYAPYILFGPTFNVTINPALSPYVKSKNITYKIITADKVDGVVYAPEGREYISNLIPTDLIYSDANLTIKESVFDGRSHFFQREFGLSLPENSDTFYDWGSPRSNDLIAIKVEIIFEYQGKQQTVNSSRIFKLKYVQDSLSDYQILHSGQYGNPFIVNNYPHFPL